MPIILKTFFCFFLFVATSVQLYAEDEAIKQTEDKQTDTEQTPSEKKQYYIVEVVLFEHLNEQGKLDEFWNRPDILNNNSISDFSDNTIVTNQLTNDIPALAEYNMQSRDFLPLRNGIAALSPENYKLADSAAHLRYSKKFNLLAHFGWTQRSLSQKRALPVRITANQFSDDLIPDGELKLYVSRYLHMQVDLKASECVYTNKMSLTEQDLDKTLDEQLENGTSELEQQKTAELTTNDMDSGESFEAEQCVNQVYQFKQNRKMRSKELHYIDNPVFGLLIYVTPFTVSSGDSE